MALLTLEKSIQHLNPEKLLTFPEMFATSIIVANIYPVLMMGQACVLSACYSYLISPSEWNHNPLIQVRKVNNPLQLVQLTGGHALAQLPPTPLL